MFKPARALPFLLVLAVPLAVTQLPPVRAGLLSLIEHMREGGATGMAAYTVVWSVGALFAAPVALFGGMAGYVYGPVRGVLVASPASVISATAAFLAGRFLLSARVARWTAHSARWQAIHKAVGENELRVAVLLRLTPIVPQNFLSYGLAMTRVKLSSFMLATWIGLLPVICFQVYVGSLVHDATEILDGKRPPLGVWSYLGPGLGLVMSVIGVVITARLARKALAKAGV